jgi:hypothetical protein
MFLLFLLGCPTWGYAKHAAINILILGDSLSAAYNIPIEKGWTRIFTDNTTPALAAKPPSAACSVCPSCCRNINRLT